MLEAEAYQFFNLGIGDPLLVSAAQGRGIGDMLDRLGNLLEKVTGDIQSYNHTIKLAVIGKENVGKSSFVNTITGEERIIVTPIPGTTRDPIDTLLKFKKHDFLLIDTAGLKKRSKIKENILFYSQLRTLRSIQRADIVLYFVDAVEGLTRYDLQMLNETTNSKKSVIIVMNKWDLIPKDHNTLHQLENEIKERLGTLFYIPVVFTSVLEKKRLYKLLDLVLEVKEEMDRKIRTSDLNNVLMPLIEKNSPPAVQGKEVKINYITQIKSAPPLFAFFGNHPQLIPNNYKRFLEKQIRNFWGFKGVPVNIVFKSKHKSKRN